MPHTSHVRPFTLTRATLLSGLITLAVLLGAKTSTAMPRLEGAVVELSGKTIANAATFHADGRLEVETLIGPFEVRTPVTRPPSTSIPSTAHFWMMSTPRSEAPRA